MTNYDSSMAPFAPGMYNSFVYTFYLYLELAVSQGDGINQFFFIDYPL